MHVSKCQNQQRIRDDLNTSLEYVEWLWVKKMAYTLD